MGIWRERLHQDVLVVHIGVVTILPVTVTVPVDTRTASNCGIPRRAAPRRPRRCRQ
jgi:hypothetical protein